MPINKFIKEMHKEQRQEELSRMSVETRLARLEKETQDLRDEIARLKRKNVELQNLVYDVARGEAPLC